MLGPRVVVICLGVGVSFSSSAASTTAGPWDPKAAAAYLDRRAEWWMAWPSAARDQGTFCVSCHTALAYSLSRPALRTALGEKAPSANEHRLLDNVIKRVRVWKEAKPYYDDRNGANKSLQSRGTESVLNALILASFDASSGKLSEDTRAAFRNMWALQETAGNEKGAWPWLDFGNEPFEAQDSLFYGACLAAVAVGTAPEGLRASPDIQDNVKLLRDYLNREYAGQSLINQVELLWASAKLPGLPTQKQQASIIDEVLSKQQVGRRLEPIFTGLDVEGIESEIAR